MTVAMLTLAGCLTASAQYQLPNPGFENWDGNGASDEPLHWNSFETADGTFSGLASTPHHYHRHGGRPGTQGGHYLTIYTRSIMGIKANGNMTTGRIHAGSMSAASSENYNYTERSNGNHCQPFGGTPDSMYVWVSFYASSANSVAQVSAIIHGDNDHRSPNEDDSPSHYCGKAFAQTTRTSQSANSPSWTQLKVPFIYDGNESAHYILVNMTTNITPGSGAANDSLSVDDIEFVYSAWLGGVNVDGNALEGFAKDRLDYTIHVSTPVDSTVVGAFGEVDDAAIDISRTLLDDTTALFTIVVTAEDGVTTKEYRITAVGEPASEPVSISDADSLPAFTIYPTPASNSITIHVDTPSEVSVFNLAGQLCHRQPLATGSNSLHVGDMPRGAYLVRLVSANGVRINKITLQ